MSAPCPKKTRYRRLKIIFFAAVLLSAAVIGGATAAHHKFSENFVHAYLEKEISRLTALHCRIGALKLSLLTGELTLTDLQLTAPDDHAPLFTLKKLTARISWLASLFTLGGRGEITADAWRLQIIRYPNFAATVANTVAEPATAPTLTDVTDFRRISQRLRELPWRAWLDRFAPLKYLSGCRLTGENGEIVWRDGNGFFADSVLSVPQFTAEKHAAQFSFAAATQLRAPNNDGTVDDGTLALTASADWHSHGRLSNLKIDAALTNFDLPQLSFYYGLAYGFQGNALTLGAPFFGDIRLAGGDGGATLSFSLHTDRLLRVFPFVKEPAQMPALTANGVIDANARGEWQIKQLSLEIGKWLALQATGGDRDGLNFQFDMTLDDFSRSELARRLKMSMSGKTALTVRSQASGDDTVVHARWQAQDLSVNSADENTEWTGNLTAAQAALDITHTELGARITALTLATGGFEMRAADRRSGEDLLLTFRSGKFDANAATISVDGFALGQPSFSPTPMVTIPTITVQTLTEPPFAVSYVLLDRMKVNYQEKPATTSAATQMMKGFFSKFPATKPKVVELVRQAAAEKVMNAIEAVVRMVTAAAAVAPPVTLRIDHGQVDLLTPGEYGDGMSLPLDLTVRDVTGVSSEEMTRQIAATMAN
ncbi:hypothetical protein FACS1894139_05630 [Planctomycetales bacterium]|nr:hypothetical protein FACS1894107_08230 [Planctomycetales bacterium]GHT00113.1 hypothetical protein FACS1894108_11480 [Planctomycetales bacterium]GHT04083.1 hypothetical protein FACS1894139_05630 [Planctomycetales bacterium]